MLYDWNIIIFYAEDDSESSHFELLLDSLKYTKNIKICILRKKCCSKYLSYNYIDPNNNIQVYEYTDKDDIINMTDSYTLFNFCNYCIQSFPSRHTALLISCHSQGWFMKHDKNDRHTFSYSDLFNLTKKNKIFFDIIFLNSCHASTLEILYELRNTTNYLVSCEYTSPEQPSFINNCIDLFSNDVKESCISIAKHYINKVNKEKAMTDISVLSTYYVTDLIESIIKHDMKNIRYKDIQYFRIFPDNVRAGQEAFIVYDLMSTMCYYFNNLTEFIDLFNKTLLYYCQSDVFKLHSDSNYSHGIGFSPMPYEHRSRGISYIKMDIYKYHDKLISIQDYLDYNG
jgi:hypothetical protein